MTRLSPDLLAFRRTQATGVAARWGLLTAVVVGALVSLFPGRSSALGTALAAIAGLAYMVLSYRAMLVSREALEAPDRLASGDLAGAEALLTQTLRRFSIFPAQRVIQLFQLATLRRRQGRPAEAVELATAALALRSAPDFRLEIELLRLEALLDLGTLPPAHVALLALLNQPHRLLGQARMTVLRIRYESAIAAHHHLLHDLPAKVNGLDFLPGSIAAESLVRLAAAAQALGQSALADRLLAKSVCLAPVARLCVQFPAQAGALRQAAAGLALL